ncbi:MAG TPA: hypothetical protein VJU61_11265 [Polyangiaceae bacterium]|nr:hypothetical protein [Polyangiaceae bacterium]
MSSVNGAGIDPAVAPPPATQRALLQYGAPLQYEALLQYAGLGFSLQGPDDLLARFARVVSYDAGTVASSPARPGGKLDVEPLALATLECRLHEASPPTRRLESASERGWLRWEWTGQEARVWTLSAEARISRRGADFSVELWLPRGDRAVQTLLGGLSSAVLHALGGAILHSASVYLDGGVIAFVGPSGAGKSTASRQAHGSLFSIDRLAIAPLPPAGASGRAPLQGPSGWMAYPLLGGTLLDPGLPRAPSAWLPLHAVLRVHQAAHGCRVETCSPTGRLALLRESTYLGGHGASTELELLSRLERLSAEVAVARLHFSLGTSLTSLLRRFISQSPPE